MTEPIQTACIAASLMLHITPSSNGYFENMWAWVADHDIDDPENTQITVAGARGILIESDAGVRTKFSAYFAHCWRAELWRRIFRAANREPSSPALTTKLGS